MKKKRKKENLCIEYCITEHIHFTDDPKNTVSCLSMKIVSWKSKISYYETKKQNETRKM